MFRRSTCLRRNPFEVLGVPSTATPSEIKAKYQELARIHHPDMPSGDPDKFREVHAAYQLLKAGKVSSEGLGGTKAWRGPNGETAQRFYGKNAARHSGPSVTAEDIRKMKEEAAKRNENSVGAVFGASKAVLAGCAGVLVASLAILFRTYCTYRDMYAQRDFVFQGELQPEVHMPSQIDTVRFRDKVTEEELLEQDRLNKEAIVARRGVKRRYDDLREYFYINDPDGCTSRKFTTQRILSRVLDEVAIPEKCSITLHVAATGNDLNTYDKNVTDVVHTKLETTHFANVDAEAVALHGALAVGRIPKLSITQNEWTFVEYKDSASHQSLPQCLLAIHNTKIPSGEGFAQRLVISGSEELQPAMLAKRRADLKSGALTPASFASPGVIPTKRQEMHNAAFER